MPKYFNEYQAAKDVEAFANGLPANAFYACLGAAVNLAGSYELDALECGFPDFVQEIRLRHNAPGGALTQLEIQKIIDKEADSIGKFLNAKRR